MNSAVLIQQAYPGEGFDKMLDLTRQRNQEYCKSKNFDFWCITDQVKPEYELKLGGWAKIELIRQALEKGYQYVVWLDADAMIYRTQESLINGCVINGIGACWHRIPQLNHWNVGVLYLHNTERVRDFVNEWLSKFPGSNDGWYEQGEFNRMAMKSNIVQTISDRWNATLNYSEVPDAVVLGFHGAGSAENRYNLMRAILNQESAKRARVNAEVNNGNI